MANHEFLRIGWQEASEKCEKLAKKIDFQPEIIIGISRGGLVPARILSDVMDIKNLGILGLKFYKGIGKTDDKPAVTQDLAIEIQGRKILIVDDIADSGRSLVFAKEYLEKKNPAEIRIATIHYKESSLVKPDYYLEETKAWVVYPWESHEAERPT